MQGRVVLCAKPECASAKPGVAGARAVSCMCKVCACKCRERNRECKGKSCGLRSGRLSPRLGQFSRPFRAKMFLIILRSQGGARKARLPWAVLANGVVARTHPLTRVVLTSSLREGCSSSEGQEVMGGQRGTLRPPLNPLPEGGEVNRTAHCLPLTLQDGKPRFFISASTFGSRPRKLR